MRGYSVGEDILIVEAALIAGVHKSRGRHGGVNELARKYVKIHQSLCKCRGLAVTRSFGSLKMRMHRLYCSGVMRWCSKQEKAKVFHKHRSPLLNIGTTQQKAKRDYLIKLLFVQPGGTMSYVPTYETKKKIAGSPQARQAVEAARVSRRARRAAERENESSTGPCYDNVNPQESCNLPAVGTQSDQPGEVIPDHKVEQKKSKMSTYQAYKENLKTVRELAAMRHDTLELMRREFESHNDSLKKSLADLGEQQKYLLRMMGTEAERK